MKSLALLEHISSPQDVQKLNDAQLCALSEEIRDFLIESVSKTGGHLSSNLGTIDLTIALHKVFSTPRDAFVWDVGHQCYTHKILTGRREGFAKLRQLGGVSGFPKPSESEHDAFIAGHGNTSLSAAIGIAQAKRLKGEAGKVIAIVGDGAFTGGMVYEGMNNIRALNNLIVILNDNKMSISKNVGTMAQYFTRLRTQPEYFAVKRNVESALDRVPVVGAPLKSGIQSVKTMLRRALYHSTMFEDMGFQYVGPVDGHDIPKLCALFSAYRDEQAAPLFIHVCTVKGKGFLPAEQNPGEFHGVSSFDLDHVTNPEVSSELSFSAVFGRRLAQLADSEPRLCAITAAMKYGTGLQYFYKSHKERFFDVGMAEQHAVTFAAGLASAGMLPVVAIYSTFLQRAYDQIIHDVNLMRANVLFAIDRAGFVPGDGETHQGIYDTAFLSEIDGVRLFSVCNYAELEYWLETLLKEEGPRALRYPRGAQDETLAALGCSGRAFDVYPAQGPARVALVTYGAETKQALAAAAAAARQGVNTDVYKLVQLHPLPHGAVEKLAGYDAVVFAEEGIHGGGIAEHLAAQLAQRRWGGRLVQAGATSTGLASASADQMRQMFALDADSLCTQLKEVAKT